MAASKRGSSSWICGSCTFVNNEDSGHTDKCKMCQCLRSKPRGTARSIKQRGSGLRSIPRGTGLRSIPSGSEYDDDVEITCDESTLALGRESISSFKKDDVTSSFKRDDGTSFRVSDLMPDGSFRLSDLMPTPENTDADEGGGDSAVPPKSNRESRLSVLGHMSFGAWESDRKAWECKACTFENDPRFLMCGACGMAEGSAAVEDELVASGMRRMTLSSAQAFLMNAVQKQLHSEAEDELKEERAMELSKSTMADDYDCDELELDAEETDQKTRSSMAMAGERIETLARFQRAERAEHGEMAITLVQWRGLLQDDASKEEEQLLRKQEEQLNSLLKEWAVREEELGQLRMRLLDETS